MAIGKNQARVQPMADMVVENRDGQPVLLVDCRSLAARPELPVEVEVVRSAGSGRTCENRTPSTPEGLDDPVRGGRLW